METNDEKDKYLQELFNGDKKIDIRELSKLINDNELQEMITSNNDEMRKIINTSLPKEEVDTDRIKKLLFINFNLYKLAEYRKIKVPDFNFILAVASFVDYPYDNNVAFKDQNYLTKK